MKKELLLCSLLAGCAFGSGTTKYNDRFPFLQTKQYDNYGQEIRIFFSQVINDASATLIDGIPTVYLNPDWMAQLSPEEQTFVFFHEVAHFRLNHPVYSSITAAEYAQEQKDADCYSGKILRDFLQFTPKQMEDVYDLVSSFSDDGPGRQRDLKNCLEERL